MFKGMQKNLIRGLMAGICLLWIVSGIITMSENIAIGVLMIANGLCFGFFAVVCKAKNRMLRLLLMVFVAGNIILTFTDQIGIFNWIVIVFYHISHTSQDTLRQAQKHELQHQVHTHHSLNY